MVEQSELISGEILGDAYLYAMMVMGKSVSTQCGLVMMRGRLIARLTIIIVIWATNAGSNVLIVILLPVYMAYTVSLTFIDYQLGGMDS